VVRTDADLGVTLTYGSGSGGRRAGRVGLEAPGPGLS